MSATVSVDSIKAGSREDEYDDFAQGFEWLGEPEPFGDLLPLDFNVEEHFGVTSVTASQFAEVALRMPDRKSATGYSNFSFDGRRHMRRIYDTPAKRILLVAARQVEKSVRVRSQILMADGSYRSAGQIRVGDRVATMDSRDGAHISAGIVSWVSKKYTKPCLKISTRQGHACEIATTHPMRVWDKWLPAGQLALGARLAVVRKAGEFSSRFMPDERIRLTAYMLGDGCTSNNFNFTSLPGPKLSEFLADLRTIATDFRVYKKKQTRDRPQALGIHMNHGLLRQWLIEDGLWGKKSSKKHLPTWAFELSKSSTALFLNRLWSTDGHCKRATRSLYQFAYCSISKRLIKEVQALLWKFGIPSKIRKNWPSYWKRRGKKRFAYILRVETQEGVRRFLSEVGAIGKTEGVPLPDATSNNNRDTYPIEINDLIKEVIETRGGPRPGYGDRGDSLYSNGIRRTLEYPLTKDKLQIYLDFFAGDDRYDWASVMALGAHLTTDLYWDTVTSIADLGEQECVDFSVEGHENFVCDGFITHNSTLLGNRTLCYSCLIPGFKTLYVSPTSTQTKTFSTDRIKEPIETSPILKAFTTKMLSQNVFEKQFLNFSKIVLRNAFLNADRTRGVPAYTLMLDEFQDILSDNVPVIEQCTSHAPEELKHFIYSGTPKSLDNNIEYYRGQLSTQGEWVVPCDFCGSSAGAGRYWNILGERNIGLKSLICEKCGHQLHPQHPDAQWAQGVAYHPIKAPFESYRVPQLMVPWKDWGEILLDYKRYPRDKFFNEVLGISYDSGMRPLTKSQVRACCLPTMSMHPVILQRLKRKLQGTPIFAGIDHGCHDEETRILTHEGFKYFRDLTDSDMVAQWDPDTRAMSFVYPKVRTIKNWTKPLLHFKSKGALDLMVTHTHRMRTTIAGHNRWVTEPAEETVKRGGNINFVGHVAWKGKEVETFTLCGVPKSPGYSGSEDRTFRMDDWLQFLGYLLSEGGLCFNGDSPSCVKITQRVAANPETAANIGRLLHTLGLSYSAFPNEATSDISWAIYGKQLWQWYQRHIGESCDEKRLPREFLKLGKRQLKILFDAMVDGDGYRDPRENCTGGAYYSTSKGLCEDFQEICIRLGLRCVLRLHKPAGVDPNDGFYRKTRWRCLWSAGCDYYVKTPSSTVEEVPYEGKVYCCSVPSGYIVTERNGCISYQGNTGENSYTVISLGAYFGNMFRIFYIHRCVGEELEPPVQEKFVDALFDEWNPLIIGSDYGGGFHTNDHLVRKFGPVRLAKFQYLARAKRKVEWDQGLRRFKVHRTEVMSDIFNSIKRVKIQFPRWEEFQEPYASDMTNIVAEYNEQLRMIQYGHSKDRPDDSFHSILYCFLASMIKFARPDVITPLREDQNRGPLNGWSGDHYQG